MIGIEFGIEGHLAARFRIGVRSGFRDVTSEIPIRIGIRIASGGMDRVGAE